MAKRCDLAMHGDEMNAGRLLAERPDHPRPGGVGVRLRLHGHEGLGTHDDEGFGRIERARQIFQLRAIDIGDEMRRDAAAPLVVQRLAHQQRPEIRAADPDVDHVLEFLARGAALLAAAHRRDELRELLARLVNLRLDGLAAGEIRAQRGVQDGAPFGDVDRIAPKHLGDAFRQVRRARQVEQQPQRLLRDPLARDVEQPAVVLDVQLFPALRIGGGQLAQMFAFHRLRVRGDGGPSGKRTVQFRHAES
jgi:hypothetical protein